MCREREIPHLHYCNCCSSSVNTTITPYLSYSEIPVYKHTHTSVVARTPCTHQNIKSYSFAEEYIFVVPSSQASSVSPFQSCIQSRGIVLRSRSRVYSNTQYTQHDGFLHWARPLQGPQTNSSILLKHAFTKIRDAPDARLQSSCVIPV